MAVEVVIEGQEVVDLGVGPGRIGAGPPEAAIAGEAETNASATSKANGRTMEDSDEKRVVRSLRSNRPDQ